MQQIFISVVLGMFAFAVTAQAGPAQKCASSKIIATGARANGKLKCWAKEVVRPGGLAACTARVDGTFARKFITAEAQDGCLTTADAGTMRAKVDAFVDDVVTTLAGAPPGTILGTEAAKRCARVKL